MQPNVRPDAPTKRKPLTRDRILRKALALADADGLEGISMRKLGAMLDVEAMSLYKHVPNKAAILEGIVELVINEIDRPAIDHDDWLEGLRLWAHSFRKIALAHPHVFRLILTPGLEFEALQSSIESILQILERAGFDPTTAILVHRSFLRFLYGALVLETLDNTTPAIRGIAGREEFATASKSSFVRRSLNAIEQIDGANEFEYDLQLFLQSAAYALASRA